MSDLKRTPLHPWHMQAKAKLAPFAGYEMPIQYTSIIKEHEHVRQHAGLFDICHMGEFLISGQAAKDALAAAVSHNLETLAPGRCRYGFILNDRGGVIDDCIIYCMDETRYMAVVNGSRVDIDYATLEQRLGEQADLEDISESAAKLDLQGPQAFEALAAVLQKDFNDLKYFAFKLTDFQGEPLLVSRTGYTGELGVELYTTPEKALPLWEALVADERVLPIGLGARDTLRLEAGLPLYGQDLDEDHTPAEAGYAAMLTSPAAYVGKEHAWDVREKLIGLAVEGRRSPRPHDAVLDAAGEPVGEVASGSYCPSVGHAIALAYVRKDNAEAETFTVRGARAELPATRVEPPFYTQGTARAKLA